MVALKEAQEGPLSAVADILNEVSFYTEHAERDLSRLSSKFRQDTGWLMNEADTIYLLSAYMNAEKEHGREGTLAFEKLLNTPGGIDDLWDRGRVDLANTTLRKTLERDLISAIRSPMNREIMGDFSKEDVYALSKSGVFSFQPKMERDQTTGEMKSVRDDNGVQKLEVVPKKGSVADRIFNYDRTTDKDEVGITLESGVTLSPTQIKSVRGMIDAAIIDVELRLEWQEPAQLWGMFAAGQDLQLEQMKRIQQLMQKVLEPDGTVQFYFDYWLEEVMRALETVSRNTRV